MASKRRMDGKGSKRKGNAYELECAKKLSLWLTGGKSELVVWRSATSGAFANVQSKSGKDFGPHMGDLIATTEGIATTFFNIFCVECKRVRFFNWRALMSESVQSDIEKYWKQAQDQADLSRRYPMLMMRENAGVDLIGLPIEIVEKLIAHCGSAALPWRLVVEGDSGLGVFCWDVFIDSFIPYFVIEVSRNTNVRRKLVGKMKKAKEKGR